MKIKKLVLVSLTVLIFGSIFPHTTHARERQLTVTAEASSVYSQNISVNNAVDGNVNSRWLGGRDASPWWISFDSGTIQQIDKISINWYPGSYFQPKSYDVEISSDGIAWETIFIDLVGSAIDILQINRVTRFVRLSQIQIVQAPFAVVSEFEAYQTLDLPRTMKFQARLGDSNKIPLDGTFNVTFRLYDVDAAGTPLWEETHPTVNVVEGMMDVELGSITAFDFLFIKQYWVGVEIESDGEMVPRFKLTAVPYAIVAEE